MGVFAPRALLSTCSLVSARTEKGFNAKLGSDSCDGEKGLRNENSQQHSFFAGSHAQNLFATRQSAAHCNDSPHWHTSTSGVRLGAIGSGARPIRNCTTLYRLQACKHAINGADIYLRCCSIRVEFAKVSLLKETEVNYTFLQTEQVNVRRNDADSWDYTVNPGESSLRLFLHSKSDTNPRLRT